MCRNSYRDGHTYWGEMSITDYLADFIAWATALTPEEERICEILEEKQKLTAKIREDEIKKEQIERKKQLKQLNKELGFTKSLLNPYGMTNRKEISVRFPRFEIEKMLTPRELEIFDYIVAGMTLPEIEEELCISKTTVKTHTVSIYSKLCVHSFREIRVKYGQAQVMNKNLMKLFNFEWKGITSKRRKIL